MKQQLITKAEFIKSSSVIEECPRPDKPEFAFIGRSNVGKSSLINMLCGRNSLAKVSSTPGKTIAINHFLINEKWYLVDLPGYGYARRSKTLRDQWEDAMHKYFLERENLMVVFVLVDSCIPPQKSDLEFLNEIGSNGIPLCIVFTKTDRNSKSLTAKNIQQFKNKMLESWEELPDTFITSSETGVGKDELLSFIGKAVKLYKP